MSFILVQPFFSLAQEDVDPKIQENDEHKCAVVITSRINDNQDPYQYALDRIRMCKKADILAVNSFLDSLTTKVYFNDLMRGFCDFEKQIIADVNKDSSSLSCVHVGKERDTLVNLDQEASEKVLKIMNFMDDLDDVQEVHTNAEFPEDFVEKE